MLIEEFDPQVNAVIDPEKVIFASVIKLLSKDFFRSRKPLICLRFHAFGFYSHSTVAGGLEVMSYTTRLTPFTSFAMRLLTFSSSS